MTTKQSGSAPAAGYALSRPWTWKDKLRCKLFPPKHGELPIAPWKFQDVLTVRTVVEPSMLDRIRILFSGRFMVESRSVMENMVGDQVTKTVFGTLPPKWWGDRA